MKMCVVSHNNSYCIIQCKNYYLLPHGGEVDTPKAPKIYVCLKDCMVVTLLKLV